MRLLSMLERSGGTPGEPTPLRRRRWAALVALVVAIGSVGAVFGAAATANSSASASHRQLATSASQIATNLQLALQHEHDLVISAGALFLDSKGMTEGAFVQWAANVQALNRYPELQGFGDAMIVPAADLGAFAAAATAAPPTGLAATTKFTVIPAGQRAFYRLSAVGLDRSAHVGLPAGFDLCAGTQGRTMLATRNSGAEDISTLTVHGETLLSLSTPIYRAGSVPTTITLRRADFVGWIGMSIEPNVILNLALRGHADTAVALRFGSGAREVSFHSGIAANHSASVTINLHNGWTVQTSAPHVDASLLGNGVALALLLVGMLLSALLGALIYVLGTSRGRAMEVVGSEPTSSSTRLFTTHSPASQTDSYYWIESHNYSLVPAESSRPAP